MPFTKVGRNKYESPSGRIFDKKQVGLYYSLGGHFPGQKGMSDQFPRNHNSPTAPGAAAKPELAASGAIDAAKSSTPTSILKGGKQTFGPLAYSRPDDQDSGFARMADREARRASRDYNNRRK